MNLLYFSINTNIYFYELSFQIIQVINDVNAFLFSHLLHPLSPNLAYFITPPLSINLHIYSGFIDNICSCICDLSMTEINAL